MDPSVESERYTSIAGMDPSVESERYKSIARMDPSVESERYKSIAGMDPSVESERYKSIAGMDPSVESVRYKSIFAWISIMHCTGNPDLHQYLYGSRRKGMVSRRYTFQALHRGSTHLSKWYLGRLRA
jgi:hypothetical protein